MSFYKVLVIGDSGVGKTSLTNKIVFNSFSEKYKATIGCEFGLKILDLNGETCRIQLWDLAGQDRLGGISRLYCKDASGAIVVGDITNRDSLQKADLWKNSVDELLAVNIPMVFCLNKCDKEEAIELSQDDLHRMGQGYAGIFKTSAKEGTNTDNCLLYTSPSPRDS